jgi:ABC-type lipoprotein release transport system permease subunit
MSTLLRIAWRNLWRGWRRSAVVVSAITVGLAACLLLIAWSHGWLEQIVQTAVGTRLGLVAVHAEGYQANPDVDRALGEGGRALVEASERFPGAHASPRVLGDGLLQSARQSARVALIGVDPEREARVSVVARSFVSGAFPAPVAPGARSLPGIAIGAALAEQIHAVLGEKLVVHAPGEAGLGAFRVAGIFATGSPGFDKTAVFMRLEDAQRLLELGDRVDEIAFSLDDAGRRPAFLAFARAELPKVRPGEKLEILSWEEREPRLAAMLGLMTNTAGVGYAAVFAGMAFGIANALLMSVYERIREFGMLRALGLHAGQLVVMVLFESVLLTVGGALLGIAVGVGIVLLLGRTGVDLGAWASSGLSQLGVGTVVYPVIGRADLVSPLLLALGTALLAAIWPAWKAARLRPAEAIRHV